MIRLLPIAALLCASATSAQTPETLTEPRTIRLQVLDTSDQPLAKAELRIYRGTESLRVLSSSPVATADDQGILIWKSLATKEDYRTEGVLSAPGRASRRLNLDLIEYDAKSRDLAEGTLRKIRLPQAIQIRGLIRDTAGKPVAGATVSAKDIFDSHHLAGPFGTFERYPLFAEARTDAKGVFKIDHAANRGVQIQVRATGYFDGIQPYADVMRPVVISLVPSGSVSGKVEYAGAPGTQKVQITYSQGSSNQHSVGPDGSYKISLRHPGAYSLSLAHQSPQILGSTGEGEQKRLEGPQSQVTLSVAKPLPPVQVRVLDSKTGAPVENAKTRLVWADPEVAHAMATTLEELEKGPRDNSVQTLPGPLEGQAHTGVIRVRAPGYAPQSVDVTYSQENPKKNLYRVKLETESVISGVVVDRESGKPLPGCTVTAIPRPKQQQNGFVMQVHGGSPSHLRTKSDAKGRFQIRELEGGRYNLGAFQDGRPKSRPRRVKVGKGETQEDVKLEIRKGYRLRGKLTGKPIDPRWRISLSPPSVQREFGMILAEFSSWRSTPTAPMTTSIAADGSFRFDGLARGSYTPFLQVPRADGSLISTPLSKIRIDEEEPPEEFKLADFLPGTIEGSVHYSGAALPPGRLLLVATATQTAPNMVAMTQSELAGEKFFAKPSGKFRLRLAKGSYIVKAFDLATGVMLYRSPKAIEVDPSEPTKVAFEIPLALICVEFRTKKLWTNVVKIHVEHPPVETERREVLGVLFEGPNLGMERLHISPGVDQIEFFAPPMPVKIQATGHGSDDVWPSTSEVIGETLVEPKAGKIHRVELKIEDQG